MGLRNKEPLSIETLDLRHWSLSKDATVVSIGRWYGGVGSRAAMRLQQGPAGGADDGALRALMHVDPRCLPARIT